MRFVLHEENLDDIDGAVAGVLRDLAEDVADDARRLAPVRTGRLRESIHVASVTDERAIVEADATRQQQDGPETYPGFVERGTSDTPAQPFLRPALFRRRDA